MYIPLSDDKHQMVRDSSKNALARMDIIVTQLLRYHMPLLYFICTHLILDSLCHIASCCNWRLRGHDLLY